MNDKKTKYFGLLSLSMLLVASCAQEDPVDGGVTGDNSEIIFHTYLPGVDTRSEDYIDKNSLKNGFSVAAACLDNVTTTGNILPVEYFSPQWVKQTEGMGEAFRADGCRWPSNKGNKDGKLRFYAFFPSLEVLRDSAGVKSDDSYFKLEFEETTNDTLRHLMKSFKVNKDITKHSDFVTAVAEGSKTDNLYSGVNLTFQRQLSRLNFEAFGNSDSYDVEIAGLRVGGILLESDFSFEGTPLNDKTWNSTRIGRWIGKGQKKGVVEYIFNEKDTVVKIGKGHHDTIENSKSIMGTSGYALVIPYDYSVWTDYKKTNNKEQTKLYFSVLLRVKERASGKNSLLYPYIEGAEMTSKVTTDSMKVVYLSIERATGKVKKRVYKKGSNFYTDPKFSDSSKYDAPPEEEIRNYGWAAAIYTKEGGTLRWNPGYQYTYQLDYSKGIGVQDPADVFPGKAILYPVEVTGTSRVWHTVDTLENKELELEIEK